MFYKCRKDVGEGKCDFFLWADEPETPPSTSYSNRNSQSKYMYIIIVAVGLIIYTGIGGLLSF